MLNLSKAVISNCIIHRPGNKARGDELWLANGRTDLEEEIEAKLKLTFFKCFSGNYEFYQFTHRIDVKMNDVFVCADKIFDDEDVLLNSQNIASHLHDQTKTPSTKSGDLFVISFDDVVFQDSQCSALGLFKCETKESIVAVTDVDSGVPKLKLRSGIGDSKPDKACLIINTNYHDGFQVLTFEKNQAETDYWRNQFLGIQLRFESEFQTKHLLNRAKEFIGGKLPSEIDLNRIDQIDLIEKSAEFFKSHENFILDDFTRSVFEDDSISESFNAYKHKFEEKAGIPHLNQFVIAPHVAKKELRGFKSIIKLDKNFHVYVHGDRSMIERGVDESGRSYYKLYFNEET